MMLILLLVLSSYSFTTANRTFRIVNQCSQTIWMGVGAEDKGALPMDGGFEVGAGETMEVSTVDEWISGRFWPRTGCKDEDGKFTCATGNCGAEDNGFKMQCKGIGGERPCTVAEFTLHSPGGDPDFYDLSNVDGHTIGMSIKPIEDQHEKVDNPDLDQKFNCGSPTCTFDSSKCPPELVMDDGAGGQVCASICAAIHNAQQREKHEHLQNIFNNEDTRSLVCCSEEGDYNHSPYNPADEGKKLCKVEEWPRSTDDQRYDEVFKNQCPDAYSWQFDDLKSTYQCRNANYEITLCPGGGAVQKSMDSSEGTGVKKTTRKLAKHLDSVATSPNAPVNEMTTEPTRYEQNQCHSYCLANVGRLLKERATSSVDNVTDAPINEENRDEAKPMDSPSDKQTKPVSKPMAGDEWQRAFEDEFDQNGEVDLEKWEFDVGVGENGWGNNEAQYYTDHRQENARCEDGQLIIEARREDFEDRQYTSARLKSKKTFLYGRLQIRAKPPGGKGTWTGLWLLPEKKTYGSQYWPDNGEIDLMELVGYEPTKIVSTVHTEENNHKKNTQATNTVEVGDATTEYHVYTLHWNPDKIEMFVGPDEENALQTSIFAWEKGDKDWKQWPFDQPFRIMLNVAVGGDWGGKQGIDEGAFPQKLLIDWVRFDTQ